MSGLSATFTDVDGEAWLGLEDNELVEGAGDENSVAGPVGSITLYSTLWSEGYADELVVCACDEKSVVWCVRSPKLLSLFWWKK